MTTLPAVTPTNDTVLAALRSFLVFVLPPSVEVIRGQVNRVAGPVGPDYLVFTPIMMKRLETNVDVYADAAFVGSVVGATLSISQMLHGTVRLGATLYGTAIPIGITVTGSLSGTGGIGTYQLSGSIGTALPAKMAVGVLFAMMPTEVTVQLDVYGPSSADNAQIVSTLFRDDYAIQQFEAFDVAPPGWLNIPPGGTISVPYDAVRPLYADDPRQTTQVLGEMQYEERWTIDACLQTNTIVTAPQQFADTVTVNFFPVDLFIPA